MARKPTIAAYSSVVPQYTVSPIPISPGTAQGGYFAETRTIVPFTKFVDVCDTLDVIASATEAGVVDRDKWVSQFFANEEIFQEFMDEFSSYDQTFRVHDRWYQALSKIANAVNEEGFATCEEMAERLLVQAQRTNQV